MKQTEKETGLNSPKPFCYKSVQNWVPVLSDTNSYQDITAHSNSEQVLQLLGVSWPVLE